MHRLPRSAHARIVALVLMLGSAAALVLALTFAAPIDGAAAA